MRSEHLAMNKKETIILLCLLAVFALVALLLVALRHS